MLSKEIRNKRKKRKEIKYTSDNSVLKVISAMKELRKISCLCVFSRNKSTILVHLLKVLDFDA